jgi:hypothetical protein
MGFAQLHPSDDAKVRELVAAPLYAFQIRVQVQFRWSEQSVWCGERLEMPLLVEITG